MFNFKAINKTNIINTLKAIDSKIDAADEAYMNGCQKAQDKIVETTVSTSKTVATKTVEMKDTVVNSKPVAKAKANVAKVQDKIVNNNTVSTLTDTAHTVVNVAKSTTKVTAWVARKTRNTTSHTTNNN